MYSEVSLYQEGEWVFIAYIILSILFLFIFIKIKNRSHSNFFKVISFLLIFFCACAQYWVFRMGMDVVYTFFSLFPRESDYLGIISLCFCIAYLYFLPTRDRKK